MDFKTMLTTLMSKDEIVSVSCNPDDPYKSCCGFILAVSDGYFIMKSVDTLGRPDGFLLRRFEEIFRIDKNGEYEQRLMYLYNNANQTHSTFDVSDNDLLVAFLEYAKANHLVVGTGIRDYNAISIYGFVKSIDIDNEMVLFSEMDDNGAETGGENMVPFDSIKRASIKSEYEIKLQSLNQGFRVNTKL